MAAKSTSTERVPRFDDRVAACFNELSPAERRAARVFQENREDVLFASAAELASKSGTSDATVVRTAKALGFTGMDELRRVLASEMKGDLSLAARVTKTLREVGDDLQAAFNLTLDIHLSVIENLRRDITPHHFRTAVDLIVKARRVVVFGIGPSSAMASYFVVQLRRFGLDATSLVQTGLLFADDLRTLRARDHLIILAYGRVYPELAVLLDEADRHGIPKILLTDTLSAILSGRVELVLPVARGRADMLSMHTGTLGLIEALLVGVAAKKPEETILGLKSLNALREKLAGERMTLPTVGGFGVAFDK